MAELMGKGLAPLPGGALDQTQKFLDACRFIWAEQAKHKADIETEVWKLSG